MPKQARQAMIFVAFAIVVALMMSIFSQFEDWKRAFTVNRADIGSVLVSEPQAEVAASIKQLDTMCRRFDVLGSYPLARL